MAHTRTWNAGYKASPADTQVTSLGATRIRELKLDVEERLVYDHHWQGDNDDGYHEAVTLLEQSSDPSTKTDAAHIYTKDDGAGVTELFFQDSAGNVLQLTAEGSYTFFSQANAWAGGQSTPEVTLTDQATIVWDADLSNAFNVTLSANRTLALPTNGASGQVISLRVIQDGTGSRTLTYNASFNRGAGIVPYLTSTAAAEDLVTFYFDGTYWIMLGITNDITTAV
jgi:hypothetical protein